MLPTPSTSHVPGNVYEPAEDSFLLLDALSAPEECAFLANRFGCPGSANANRIKAPLIVELGSGSGVVLAFVTANADKLFSAEHHGCSGIMTLGIDVNTFACVATRTTVDTYGAAQRSLRGGGQSGVFLNAVLGDLTGPLRPQVVDVLIFNPPYVPSETLPEPPLFGTTTAGDTVVDHHRSTDYLYERDSQLLALATDGGKDGMEVTTRVLDELRNILDPDRGVAYVLLCAQNKPDQVKARLRSQLGESWDVRTIRRSGRQAGWESLQIVRIARIFDCH